MSLSSQHYLKKLDFDLIKNKIAALSSFYISKELSLSFNPSDKFNEVKNLQLETYQCRELLINKGYLNCSEIDDSLSNILIRIEKNGLLTSSEVLVVKFFLNVLSEFKNLFINQNKKFTLLENIAKEVPDLDHVIVKINEAIGENGFILWFCL